MSILSKLFNRKSRSREVVGLPEDSNLDTEVVEDEEDFEKVAEASDSSTIVDYESKEVYEVVEREIHPAKIICPDCGGVTLEGLDFCDKCGGEL